MAAFSSALRFFWNSLISQSSGISLSAGSAASSCAIELAEGLIVAIEQRFVFDQRHARQMIEVIDAWAA